MSRTMANSRRSERDRTAAKRAFTPVLAFLGLALILAAPVRADERVQFPSLDGKLSLTGFLYRPGTR